MALMAPHVDAAAGTGQLIWTTMSFASVARRGASGLRRIEKRNNKILITIRWAKKEEAASREAASIPIRKVRKD